MDAALFDYHLPPERIAQEPAAQRDQSRLLVVDRASQSLEHRRFRDIVEYLRPDDLLFRNVARVLPARLFAQRPTGGQVECLLLRPAAADSSAWWCLLRPGKRLPSGSRFGLPDWFDAQVEEKNEQAEYRVRFSLAKHSSVVALANELGKMPLPPYIRRGKTDPHDKVDRDRYQTVYAQAGRAVAAAAPTAGLHFTEYLNAQIQEKGIAFHDLTLHVGMGTFKPLESERLEDHEIHRELYEIPPPAQGALFQAGSPSQRRVSIGTTSARSIEDFLLHASHPSHETWIREADLFIYPPYRWRGVDALVTNFHLPKSTLLCLVAAILRPGKTDGIHWLKEIYAEALDREYRFLSYGDAMLIL